MLPAFVKKPIRFIKHHKRIAGAVVAIILIIVFIFRPKAPQPLETQQVKKTDLTQSISVSGAINAKNQANLSFLTAGQVVYIGAKKNDSVSKGQTIASLDTRSVQKSLQQTLLDYSKQRNTFDQTRINNGINNDSDVPANDFLKRILQNNQYDLDKSVNSVELQDLARQQSFLVSPISGILIRADAMSIGSTVGPTTIFTVVDPTSIVFDMDVDEADIGKIQQGQSVKIILDAYPDRTLQVTVDAIDFVSHTTSSGGNAFTVEVKLPGSDINEYRIGMNGNGEIITAQKNEILTVPLSSVGDGNMVYVKKGSKYEKRKITLGLANDTDVEALSGVNAGDLVVLTPDKVQANQVIK